MSVKILYDAILESWCGIVEHSTHSLKMLKENRNIEGRIERVFERLMNVYNIIKEYFGVRSSRTLFEILYSKYDLNKFFNNDIFRNL